MRNKKSSIGDMRKILSASEKRKMTTESIISADNKGYNKENTDSIFNYIDTYDSVALGIANSIEKEGITKKKRTDKKGENSKDSTVNGNEIKTNNNEDKRNNTDTEKEIEITPVIGGAHKINGRKKEVHVNSVINPRTRNKKFTHSVSEYQLEDYAKDKVRVILCMCTIDMDEICEREKRVDKVMRNAYLAHAHMISNIESDGTEMGDVQITSSDDNNVAVVNMFVMKKDSRGKFVTDIVAFRNAIAEVDTIFSDENIAYYATGEEQSLIQRTVTMVMKNNNYIRYN